MSVVIGPDGKDVEAFPESNRIAELIHCDPSDPRSADHSPIQAGRKPVLWAHRYLPQATAPTAVEFELHLWCYL